MAVYYILFAVVFKHFIPLKLKCVSKHISEDNNNASLL